MRVLQLIDTLQAGGAERIAVTLANALIPVIEKSYLCATRDEGLLKESLNAEVGYLFLNKKSTLDTKAIKRLNAYIKTEKINIVHAHSSSFFTATILKLLNYKIKIVWHDHYGNRASASKTNTLILKQCSKQFSHIFCVNQNLVDWSKNNLKCKHVSFLPNFVIQQKTIAVTKLKGEKGKRIVCLANLREDKDHFNAIEAFKIVQQNNPDWSLHFVGKSFNDDYSNEVEQKVKALKLEKSIFFYGSIADVSNVLNESTIGILSSVSEGLPMALLEYGIAGLPVVVTNVGNCGKVILDGELGELVPPKNSITLARAIQNYIGSPKLLEENSKLFNKHILENYSVKKVVKELILEYKNILKTE